MEPELRWPPLLQHERGGKHAHRRSERGHNHTSIDNTINHGADDRSGNTAPKLKHQHHDVLADCFGRAGHWSRQEHDHGSSQADASSQCQRRRGRSNRHDVGGHDSHRHGNTHGQIGGGGSSLLASRDDSATNHGGRREQAERGEWQRDIKRMCGWGRVGGLGSQPRFLRRGRAVNGASCGASLRAAQRANPSLIAIHTQRCAPLQVNTTSSAGDGSTQPESGSVTQEPSSDDGGIGGAAIAGIVIGCLLLAACVVGALLYHSTHKEELPQTTRAGAVPSNFGSSSTTHNPAFIFDGTATGDPQLASTGGGPAPAAADPSRGGLFDLNRAYEVEGTEGERGAGSGKTAGGRHYSTPGTDVNPAYDIVQEAHDPSGGGGGGAGAGSAAHTAPGHDAVLTQRGVTGGQDRPAYDSVLTQGDEGRGGADGAYDSVLTQQANVACAVPYDSVLTSATPPSAARPPSRTGTGQVRPVRPARTGTGTSTAGDPRYTHISAAEIARATRVGNASAGAGAGGDNGRSEWSAGGGLRVAQAPTRAGRQEPRPGVDPAGYVTGEGAAASGVPTYAVPTSQALGADGAVYEGVEELQGGGGGAAPPRGGSLSRGGRGGSVRSLQGFGLEDETST